MGARVFRDLRGWPVATTEFAETTCNVQICVLRLFPLRYPIRQTNFVANLFSIPHRPTKLLIEPAACKSLKILEVASRALASLLITESGICGNRAAKRAVQGATLATSLRFSLGEQAKKIPTDKSWDFEYWWSAGNRRQTVHELLKRANVGW